MRYAFDKRHSLDADMEHLTKGNNSVNKLVGCVLEGILMVEVFFC